SVASKVIEHPGVLPLRLFPTGFPLAILDSVRLASREVEDSLHLRFHGTEMEVRGREKTIRVPYGRMVDLDGVSFAMAAAPDVESGLLVAIPEAASVDSLLALLEVAPRARTDLLDVGFSSHDPEVAVSVVNAVAQVFKEVSSDEAREAASIRRVFLEEQLQQNDSVLTLAQVAISQLRARNRAYSSQDMFAASQAGMADLDVQRVALEVEYRSYQSLLDELTTNSGRSLASLSAGAASNPVVTQLYTQLLRQQASYDSLTTGPHRSAESNPDVIRMASLLESTRGQLIDAVRSHANSIGARLEAVGGVADARASAFSRLPAAEVEEARLAMQLDALT